MSTEIREGRSGDLAACTEIRDDWLLRFHTSHAKEECSCPAGLLVPWVETMDQLRTHLESAQEKRALVAGEPGKGIVAYLLYQANENRRQVFIKGHQPMWCGEALAAAGAAVECLLDSLGQLQVDRVCVALHGFAWETAMLKMMYGERGFRGTLRYEMLSRCFDLDGGRPDVEVQPAGEPGLEAFYHAEVASGHTKSADESREDCQFSQNSWNVTPPQDWLIAYVQGQVAGTARVAVTRQQIGVLDDLTVSEGFRGKGVGRALLSKALQTLKGRTDVVWLDVDDDNQPAIRLYRAAGFHIQHHHGMIQFEKVQTCSLGKQGAAGVP